MALNTIPTPSAIPEATLKHTITSSGTLAVNGTTFTPVDYFIVAVGGGASGSTSIQNSSFNLLRQAYGGGGGGASGAVSFGWVKSFGGTANVTIGSGGPGQTGQNAGVSGGQTQINFPEAFPSMGTHSGWFGSVNQNYNGRSVFAGGGTSANNAGLNEGGFGGGSPSYGIGGGGGGGGGGVSGFGSTYTPNVRGGAGGNGGSFNVAANSGAAGTGPGTVYGGGNTGGGGNGAGSLLNIYTTGGGAGGGAGSTGGAVAAGGTGGSGTIGSGGNGGNGGTVNGVTQAGSPNAGNSATGYGSGGGGSGGGVAYYNAPGNVAFNGISSGSGTQGVMYVYY